MKKMIFSSAICLLIASLFITSCASSKAGGKDAPASVHPREYTIDLAESFTGTEIPVVYNEYGPNYQSNPALDFSKFIRKDKPQAGDLIHVYYKFTADTDIPMLRVSLIDPTVNYWLELAPDEAIMIEDIKAGETYEGEKDIPLSASVKGEFKVYLAYDNQDFIEQGYARVDGPANFTFYDVEEAVTTDVMLELPADAIQTGPKTINIEIQNIAAFCEVATGHPWVNGKQIMSEIENYQADISYMSLLEEPPVPGDILVVHWRGKPSQDISVLKCMPVDHSASVGWWRIMINNPDDEDAIVIGRDLKAGEVFDITKTYVIDVEAASTDCNLRVWYDYDPVTNGPGPCDIIGVRN